VLDAVCAGKVDREKQQSDALLTRSTADRTSLDHNMRRLEDDNLELQRQLQALQTQLAQAEHDHTNKYVHTQSAVLAAAILICCLCFFLFFFSATNLRGRSVSRH